MSGGQSIPPVHGRTKPIQTDRSANPTLPPLKDLFAQLQLLREDYSSHPGNGYRDVGEWTGSMGGRRDDAARAVLIAVG
jgi:hypothetical protein